MSSRRELRAGCQGPVVDAHLHARRSRGAAPRQRRPPAPRPAGDLQRATRACRSATCVLIGASLGPAALDPVGVERVERRELDVDEPLGRRDVAVQTRARPSGPGTRGRAAAARRSSRPRAWRRDRRCATAVGVPMVNPSTDRRRRSGRPRAATPASFEEVAEAAPRSSGRCPRTRPPTSFDTHVSVMSRSISGTRRAGSSKSSVELAVDHAVDPEPPVLGAAPTERAAPCRRGRSERWG